MIRVAIFGSQCWNLLFYFSIASDVSSSISLTPSAFLYRIQLVQIDNSFYFLRFYYLSSFLIELGLDSNRYWYCLISKGDHEVFSSSYSCVIGYSSASFSWQSIQCSGITVFLYFPASTSPNNNIMNYRLISNCFQSINNLTKNVVIGCGDKCVSLHCHKKGQFLRVTVSNQILEIFFYSTHFLHIIYVLNSIIDF